MDEPVVLQVRPMCDALYASRLEPWSEWLTGREGQAPDPYWDPLDWAVTAAHARGLELHAWFNPFRARHAGAKGPASSKHVQNTMPNVLRRPRVTTSMRCPTRPASSTKCSATSCTSV